MWSLLWVASLHRMSSKGAQRCTSKCSNAAGSCQRSNSKTTFVISRSRHRLHHSWLYCDGLAHHWLSHSWLCHNGLGYAWLGHGWLCNYWLGHNWLGHGWLGMCWLRHGWLRNNRLRIH
jgi:hypothetical protein